MNLAWYQDIIRDHYHNPRNKGVLEGACVIGHLQNPSCGDMVLYTVKITAGMVSAVGFEGTGCVMSQAAASLLGEALRGKSIADIIALKPHDMEQLMGIPIGPVRMRCVVLPLEAIQKGISDYARSNQAHTSVS